MPRPNRARNETGAGVISVTLGVLMFLVMVFTATQFFVSMYVSSTVDGVSYDAARIVAQSGSSTDAAARAEATAHVTSLLGGSDGLTVSFEGTTDATVRLTVTVTPPGLIGPSFGIPWLDDVSRTSEVRVERHVEPVR